MFDARQSRWPVGLGVYDPRNVCDGLGAIVIDDNVVVLAILADKLDLTEEVVRLRTHLDAATTTLDAHVPAGKRLGFLGQEMLREINTIGSKANDATIAHTVVDMKGELEKFREQIENLE